MAAIRPHISPVSVCSEAGWDDARGKITWRTLFSAGLTPTHSMTGGVATVAPGGFLALHRHAPPEIYFILEGEGCMSLDGRERPIKAGDGVFIPGNVEHGVRNEGSATLRILYVFPVDSFDEIKYVFS